MAHTHHLPSTTAATSSRGRAGDPAFQAFYILRSAFTLAPIVVGADKFSDVLVNWDRYLAPSIAGLSPFGVHETMYLVGVVEILAGLLVAALPRLGAPVVSLWLLGIIVNLLLIPGYYDVAVRDFGLFLAALALWRLATAYDSRSLRRARSSQG